MNSTQLPPSWQQALRDEFDKPYFRELQAFLCGERAAHEIYPPESDVFAAFQFTPLDRVAVLILGQDPYHGVNQAHGLSFSVRPGVALPPSLRNIVRELRDDLECPPPTSGSLELWARQGVLLLNAVLTVRAGQPASHQRKGWETFTDAVIRAVNAKAEPVVFVLWGGFAQKKTKLIDATRHAVIASAHPSPLSAKLFFGSRPFSKINAALESLKKPKIEWCL